MRVIKSDIRRTPLLNSPAIDDLAGRRVWIKAECLQHTGSFKYRGASSAIGALSAQQRAKGVLAFSSGNHAQGIAAAARAHNVSAKIIMPSDSPQIKIDNTRALGGQIVFFDRATEDRERVAAKINTNDQRVLIKPFDNAHVIAGQASVGVELAQQSKARGINTAQVLICCGGGGLTAGVALALAHDVPNFTVHPVEPVGFDDVKQSLQLGQIVRNSHTSGSICDAILTSSAGDMTFPIMAAHCGAGLTVSDDQALHAMAIAFAHLKIVLEPGGAVSLAAALAGGDMVHSDDVICVVSGGNVDAHMFARALEFAPRQSL